MNPHTHYWALAPHTHYWALAPAHLMPVPAVILALTAALAVVLAVTAARLHAHRA